MLVEGLQAGEQIEWRTCADRPGRYRDERAARATPRFPHEAPRHAGPAPAREEALSRWEAIHAAAAMPEDLRPPPVRQPSVSWPALKELQSMFGEVLGELEESWERRN
jgi:hypothetical protein